MNQKKSQTINTICIFAVLACICVASWQIIADQKEQEASEITKPTTPTALETLPPEPGAEPEPPAFVSPIDFAALQKNAKTAVGWITIGGTQIDYPVVQGHDNQYYVKHAHDGKETRYGAIFLDFRSSGDFSDGCSVIYGHNMKSGKMFGNLRDLKKKELFRALRYGVLYLPTQTLELELFAWTVLDAYDEFYQELPHSTERIPDLLARIKTIAKDSREIEFQEGDRILALSTCSHENERARTVVFARYHYAS